MPEENLAVSGTDDGNGHGYLCYRANLAKPESGDLFLNMLDINQAIGAYQRQKMSIGALHQESLALITRLTITEQERAEGTTLSNKLNNVSKQELNDRQRKTLKDVLTLALQHDLHQTIKKTQALAEMLALYSEQ